MKDRVKFELQNRQYAFPYHYLPHFDSEGYGQRHRSVSRGLEYLCYVRHVQEKVAHLEPQNVLEVGCGDGCVIGGLPKSIERVGADLSERAIRFANAFHEDVNFIAVDAEELNDEFDVVLAVEVLEHIPDEEAAPFIRTLEKKTRRGGHVIITVPSLVKPLIEKHYRHYSREVFESQLEASGANLQIEKVEHIYHDTKLMSLYRRFTENRIWYFEPHALRRRIWRHVWNELRYATPETGEHLVVTLQRPRSK